MIRNKLVTFLLLLNAVSSSALTGKIALSPGLFEGWQFTQSFVFAKEQGRYYPVGPDGSFNIPPESTARLTLTTFVPGFNKETATFPAHATDVNIVVTVQTVSMEETTYDAEVPKWLFDLKTRLKQDLQTRKDRVSPIPFEAKTGIDGKPELFLDLGKLIPLVEKLISK
jgi:hypothetical protein